MKKKVFKITSIAIVILLLGIIGINIALKKEEVTASESSLSFNYAGEQRSPFKNKAYDYSTKYRKVTLGENTAVCVDYGKEIPSNGTSLVFKEKMSPEALAVLVYGYPNKDLGEFGLSSEEEEEVQYLVTQMAFWNVTTQTGENKGLDFNFNDLVANSGYESIMDKMKSAAEKLASTAMKSPYNPNPAIKIDTSNYKLEEKNDLYIAGPYKITGYDGGTTTDFTVLDVSATLENAPSTAFIADANGTKKSTFAIGDEVYVVARKSDSIANFKLTVSASGNKLSCGKYGLSSASGIQDFATIVADSVTVSETVNITWSNDTGNIKLLKTDDNNKGIKDVRFEVRNSNKEKIAEVVTNSNGIVELLNLPVGTYTFKEISAPSGYAISEENKTVSVSAGSTSEVGFINNEQGGQLEITKVDENGDKIANVTFKILDKNYNKVETITTNSKGKAYTSTLSAGTYYFVEIDAPDNVMIDSTRQKFTISNNKTTTKTVENDLVKGSLKITKVDESDEPLSGVKFEILNSNKRKIETITTNNSGIAVSSDLEPGTYYYKEISAKDNNLIIDEEEKKFIITDNTVVKAVKEVNKYKKGSLKIIKIDQSKNPIEGVTFEIYNSNKEKIDTIVTNASGIATSNVKMVLGTYYYKEISGPSNVEIDPEMKSFKLTEDGQVVEISITNNIIEGKLKLLKVDENNQPINGVEFEILDSSKNVIQTITTNELGVAITNTLNIGEYYYREKSTLSQYVLDTTENAFSIKTASDFIEKTVVNKLKSAKLVLNKINKDTGEPIENVRFEILDSNKNIIASIVTDANGKAETEELKNGTYYYKEVTAPDNIVIDSNEYEFKIEEQNVNVEKTVYNVQKKLPVTGSLFSTNVIIVIIVSVSCILLYIIIKMIIAYIENRN